MVDNETGLICLACFLVVAKPGPRIADPPKRYGRVELGLGVTLRLLGELPADGESLFIGRERTLVIALSEFDVADFDEAD